jgi:hypothetical protein
LEAAISVFPSPKLRSLHCSGSDESAMNAKEFLAYSPNLGEGGFSEVHLQPYA